MYKKVLLSVLCTFLIFNSVCYKGFATEQATNDLELKSTLKECDNPEFDLDSEFSMTEEEFLHQYDTSTVLVDGDGSGTGSSSSISIDEVEKLKQLKSSNFYIQGTINDTVSSSSIVENYGLADFLTNNSVIDSKKSTYVFSCGSMSKVTFRDLNWTLSNVSIRFVDQYNNTLSLSKNVNKSDSFDVPKNAVLFYIQTDGTYSATSDYYMYFTYQSLMKKKYYFNIDWSNYYSYVFDGYSTTSNKYVSSINIPVDTYQYIYIFTGAIDFYSNSGLYGDDFINCFTNKSYSFIKDQYNNTSKTDESIYLFQIPKNCNKISFPSNSHFVLFSKNDNLDLVVNCGYTKHIKASSNPTSSVTPFLLSQNYTYPFLGYNYISLDFFNNVFSSDDLSNSRIYFNPNLNYAGARADSGYLKLYNYNFNNITSYDSFNCILYSGYENYFSLNNGTSSNPGGGSSGGGSSSGSTNVNVDLSSTNSILKQIYDTLEQFRQHYVANSKDLFDILKDINSKLSSLNSTDLTNTNNLINQVLSKLDTLNTSIKNINVSVPSVDLSKIYERLDTLISKVQSLDDNNRTDFKSLLKALEDLQINNNISNVTNKEGKSIWDFLTEVVKGLSDVLIHLTDGLADISTKLLELVDKFMDMLISLIVPDDSFFNDYFQSIHDDFSSRTGLFTSPLNVATNVVDQFKQVNQSGEYVLTIPNIDLLGVRFINEQSYDVQEAFGSGEMSILYNYYMIVIKGIFSLLFLNYLRRKFEHGILGGSNA